MPNHNEVKTLLALGDGSSLVASIGGDQYWIMHQDGSTTPCSLQKASMYWLQYEETLEVGPQYPNAEAPQGVVAACAPASTNPSIRRNVREFKGEYSPWQRELLEKLGLTEADVDPLGSRRNKSKKSKE